MTYTRSHAERELDILEATVPNAIITPFREEILALCEAFGKSGQSGGSAPFTAYAISQAVKKLCLHQSICPLTGDDSEWVDVSDISLTDVPKWQNSRRTGVFKYGDGRAIFIDAIVWQGEEEYDTFTGRVYIDEEDFALIGSDHYVKFPFEPKTFYVDVVRVPISKEEAESRNMYYIEDGNGDCYYTVVKDPNQLDEVFEYYDYHNINKKASS